MYLALYSGDCGDVLFVKFIIMLIVSAVTKGAFLYVKFLVQKYLKDFIWAKHFKKKSLFCCIFRIKCTTFAVYLIGIMNKNILHLALPSIVSNITVPLLGLVDVTITGHMGDARYMAAIAVGSMIFNIIYWLFAFLRFGTGGMTAQSYGEATAKNASLSHPVMSSFEDCCHILLRAQLTCGIMALLLLLFQQPLFALAMWFIAPEAQLQPIIHTYFNICIWGTLPSLSLYAFTGWFVGMQNTTLPMVISITQNVVNICLSCLFVYGMGMKIEGVAMGTLLAQWCGVVMALLMVRFRYAAMWRSVRLKGAVRIEQMKRFFLVNRTLFYRTLFLVAVNLYIIVAGAKSGAVILAVNSVLMQMFILYTYVMDGFAFAAEALCGRYYGAKDSRLFSLALRGVWLWGLGLTTCYTIAYAVGGEAFLAMLTDDATIRHAATAYLTWAIAIPFCGIAAFVWDGVFVGITNTKGMLWGTFCGATAFFASYFALRGYIGNHALWLAFCAYLFMRGAAQQVIYYKERKDFFNC